MTVRAVVRGSGPSSNVDSNVNEVRFFVYDSSGTLVHWYTDTGAKYCLFGGGGSCTMKRINVDHWWYGSSNKPGPLITNDTYTFVIMAQNNDGDNRKKSALDVYEYRLYGPTPTKTPIPPTKTFTPIPPTKIRNAYPVPDGLNLLKRRFIRTHRCHPTHRCRPTLRCHHPYRPSARPQSNWAAANKRIS